MIDAPSPIPGEVHLSRIGPYEVDRLLGRGAIGDVYLAHGAPQVGHEPSYVAIKVLNRGRLRKSLLRGIADPNHPIVTQLDAIVREAYSRFHAEAHAGLALTVTQSGDKNERLRACGVHHPALVSYLDRGTHEGEPYFVMEYVPGRELHAFLDESFPVFGDAGEIVPRRLLRRVAEVARLGALVADGLAAIHARNVIHRDVKPANLLVFADPRGQKQPRVKVIDLGIARIPVELIQDPMVTQIATSYGLGTTAYASPEQIQNPAQVTPKTDVYALGRTLQHVLVTGTRAEESFGAAWTTVVRHAAEAADVHDAVSDFQQLLARMTDTRPDARPTMRNASVELQRLARRLGAVGGAALSVEAFADAVFAWETSGRVMFPSSSKQLEEFLTWAKENDLTTAEESFLRGFELHLLRCASRRTKWLAVAVGAAVATAASLSAVFIARELDAARLLEEKNARMEEAVADNDQLAGELRRLTEEIGAIVDKRDGSMTDVRERFRDLKGAVTKLEQERDELAKLRAELDNDKKKVTGIFHGCVRDRDEARESLSQCERSLSDARDSDARHQAELADANRALDRTTAENRQLRDLLETAGGALAQCTEQRSSCTASLDEAREARSTCDGSLATCRARPCADPPRVDVGNLGDDWGGVVPRFE